MLKNLFLILIMVLAISVASFANVIIINETPLKGKINLSEDDINFINSLVSYSLNDLSDVLQYKYITPKDVETWYNSVVEIVNSTNTNTITVGKKQQKPKPLPKIIIKSLDSKTISTITKLLPEIKGVMVASYNLIKNSVVINLQNINSDGKLINKSTISIPLEKITDRDWILLTTKEGIVDLLNAWKFYYYDPSKTATLKIAIKPQVKNLSILTKPDDTPLKVGNNILKEGEYTLVISAPGYEDVVTNIYLPPMGNISLSFTLKSATKIESLVPIGTLYIDANVKGVPLIIAEGNIIGVTPLYTNVTEGIKNIIFQQTPTTLLKSLQIEVKPNQFNYYFVNLERIGAGVNIIADNGTFVVIDRKLEGKITTGSYSKILTKGIHTITVFKNGFEPFRTNINVSESEKINIKASLSPKKVPVLIVTPQSKEAIIRYQGKDITTVYNPVKLEPSKESQIDIVAQEFGYNNSSVSVIPSFNKINSAVVTLSPLYGDLLIITDPVDALVKIDGNIVGKTTMDGLLLKSLPARKSVIFIQKENYKPIKTNTYIMPNIQNSLMFKLKEAPIKLFINTTPVTGVSIYVNDEYYGENDGVINVELGKSALKLLKRGFKTIYTNLSFPEKLETIIPLTFQMTPGSSEIELVETVNNNIPQIDNLISNENY
ncbi:MAG: PEGA domain-containing protein, partial [Brevinematia bacterium]